MHYAPFYGWLLPHTKSRSEGLCVDENILGETYGVSRSPRFLQRPGPSERKLTLVYRCPTLTSLRGKFQSVDWFGPATISKEISTVFDLGLALQWSWIVDVDAVDSWLSLTKPVSNVGGTIHTTVSRRTSVETHYACFCAALPIAGLSRYRMFCAPRAAPTLLAQRRRYDLGMVNGRKFGQKSVLNLCSPIRLSTSSASKP
ncbi:hypothetical protein R3P38DRAFT_2953086, partial [Favolaschia claudopus]